MTLCVQFFQGNLVRARAKSLKDDSLYCLSNQHVASCCFMFCVILCVATKRNVVRKNYSKGA
jgi:hypothetical protein